MGYVTTTEYQELKRKHDEIFLELASIKRYNRDNRLINVDVGDPAPVDTDERKIYVARVAAFFQDVLEEKFKSMISNIHNLIEEEGIDEKQHYKLLGAVYSLRELLVWGKNMINEHVSYQSDTQDVTGEEIDKLKQLLK